MQLHIVQHSPWPFYISITLLSLLISSDIYSVILLGLISFQWFRDIIRESYEGHHTKKVQKNLIIGYILFLVSEVMLFFSFFWSYFHSSLAPTIELALIWPPLGIEAVNYLSIPLLGSIILLSSGFFITLSHHALILGNKNLSLWNGVLSIFLGILFVFLQLTEYYYSGFTIADSVYGSVFYMTTSLHGLHVIIGTLFLIVQYIRLYLDHFTLEHHLGLEFAIYYWHLVDVIWLFVFVSYYWWGS